MSWPVCPCDAEPIVEPTNLPERDQIAYRIGTYVDFRQRVLTPLFEPASPEPQPVEQTLSINGLPVWRTDGNADLAVMIAEWFAYIADIITFYNERIANEDYLRTAVLSGDVNNLIALLGYRPRPAIGATGSLAALVSTAASFGNAPIVLPKGLQFQSKPTPGQAPQTFELFADTAITRPDRLSAEPQPELLGLVEQFVWHHFGYYYGKYGYGGGAVVTDTHSSTLLLRGAVKTISPGALLKLRARNGATGPWLATVTAASIGPQPSGSGQQTSLTFTLSGTPPTPFAAADASLASANQSVPLWGFFRGAVSVSGSGTSATATVHLASLARQVAPGDWVLFAGGSGSPTPTPVLVQVASTKELSWNALGSADNPDIPDPIPSGTLVLPIPHTELTFTGANATALSDNYWTTAKAGNVRFGWVSVGDLLNQPFAVWTGSPLQLIGTSATPFPAGSNQSILLQDSTGLGITATAGSAGDFNLTLGTPTEDPVPSLQPPFVVLPNVLAVTRGKTVQNEILGSGNATQSGQDFQLSQSPVTYLQQGASYASTIALTVNNLPWTEVANFYGQPADATVFVTREDNKGKTHVMFGDGVNGARLATGTNNVIATYRVGAGALSPPAGKLTVIAKPYPGLRAVLNPMAVGGGSDADPPDLIRHYAPQSVLTFGRAVSVFDYQALAAQVPGVTRAGAVWAWDDTHQRALIRVYVGDDAGAQTAAQAALAAAGDPNRPVHVTQATQKQVALTLTLIVTPGMDTTIIAAAVKTALTDTEIGLFGSWNMGIGRSVFVSQLEATVLGVQGAVALTSMAFLIDGVATAGPIFNPGEGCYFTLDPADIFLTTEPDPNG